MARLSLVAVLAVHAVLLLAQTARAEPYRPDDDARVLVELPAMRPDRATRTADPVAAAKVAQRFIELARTSGDPRFLGYAEGVLQTWMDTAAPPDPVLLLRATLRQSRHDFKLALADLDTLLARDPRHAQALITRATILRVQGRFAAAADTCAKLQGLTDAFIADLCIEAIRGCRGQLASAATALDAMVPASRQASSEIRAWFAAERAEQAARLGRPAAALRIYASAILEGLGSPALRADLADVLLDLGRPPEVLALAGAGSDNELLDLRAAIAARALGQPRPELEAALADFHAAARRRGHGAHLREEARFELEIRKNADRALALARENWQQQREAADARLLLEAARQAGSPRDAAAVHAWLRDSGFEDARLRPLLDETAP